MKNTQKVLQGRTFIMIVLMLKFKLHSSEKIQNSISLFILIIWYLSFQFLFK